MNKINRFIALILTVVMLLGTLMLEVGAATAVDIIYQEDENGKPTDMMRRLLPSISHVSLKHPSRSLLPCL